MKVLMVSMFFSAAVFVSSAYALDASGLIRKIEDNLNGKTAFMKFTMKVRTKRAERTMRMESYSVGKEKSFVKVTYPRKDKGITFLKVDHTMWQYVPKIERVIKIPASMMLQSWMGSDFTNDDLVRESSIADDYHAKIIAETNDEYGLELIPRDQAPVVWGKVVMKISKEYYLPTEVVYFDEEGEKVRVLHYGKVERFDGRFYPTHWVMVPLSPDKEGHRTVFDVDEAVFDQEISDEYFTKRALKRFAE